MAEPGYLGCSHVAGVTSPNVSPALLPGPSSLHGLVSSHAPSIPGLGIGLAVPACPLLVQKGPRVGGQPPQSRLMSECEDYWLLPRRRAWPSPGNPAAAKLLRVTSRASAPPLFLSHLPGPGLGLATALPFPGPGVGLAVPARPC